MKIAVNTRLLLKGKLEGIGLVTYEILRRVTRNHPEHEFYFLFDRKYSDDFLFSDNIIPLVVPPQSRLPILWYTFFEISMPLAVRHVGADLLISTDGWTSIRAKVPKLTIFHDLNFEHSPEFIPPKTYRYLKKYVPEYAHASDRIVAVSNYTKQDIVNTYNVPEEKIDVMHISGSSSSIIETVDDNTITEIKRRYTSGCDYFVFVGSLHKRKNVENQLLAFDKFKQQNEGSNVKFVIIGRKMWRNYSLDDVLSSMEHKDDVIFTGFIPSEDVGKLVASSLAMLYVSLFEGFGMPLVEAFKLGVPVITSTTTSMPEVAGDAALLVEPTNIDAIAEAMSSVYRDQNLRNVLIQKGKERGKMFDWDISAEIFWQSVEKVLR